MQSLVQFVQNGVKIFFMTSITPLMKVFCAWTINMDSRNLIDHYKYWNDDAIRADLDSKRFNYSIVCCNIGNDFNIATVIRNANAFLAKEVVIYGNKKYDRRGTVGTHHYTNFKHVKSVDNLFDYFVELRHNLRSSAKQGGPRDLRIVSVDNVDEAVNITEYEFDVNTHYVFVFGQEQIGIPQDVLDMADDIVYIPQYGSVRSINVGTASGIIMNTYCAAVTTTLGLRV
jgi:tRNA G18 (ribose-2'-O)-methylase SpoU